MPGSVNQEFLYKNKDLNYEAFLGFSVYSVSI